MEGLIANDVSRCSNMKCPTSAYCARYRQWRIEGRSKEGIHKEVSVTQFDGDKQAGLCDFFINVEG